MPYDNFVQVLLDHFEKQPAAVCFRFFRNGSWRELTYGDVTHRVRAIAAGLVAMGVQPGDRVAIVSRNRIEWNLADLGAILAGCVVVSAYAELRADETAYILRHSGARVAFVEDERQCVKILEEREHLPDLERVVVFDGSPGNGGFCQALARFESSGIDPAPRIEEAKRAPGSTPLMIVYTSGTTGAPKGAILTHHNVLWVVETVLRAVGEEEPPKLNLSFLPMAHALERIGGHFTPLYIGGTIAIARSLETVAEDFGVIRPDFAIGVPRFFEKVYDKVMAQMRAASPVRRAIAEWAMDVGRRRSVCLEAGKRVPVVLSLAAAVADRLVFSKLKRRLGGRVRFFVSGGAPLNPDVARFFHAAGILICEGYGATETSAPATINTPSDYRFGTVGKPLPGVEMKLAADGEILVRGPNVFKGYFKDAEATAAAFDADGFYKTGDVGAIDEDGYYTITDRKKELIITAAGKNIAPQKIENMLRERPYISNALVHCDRRPYLVAILTLDRAAIEAEHPELAGTDHESAQMRTLLDRQVSVVNERLARFEQIKNFRLLDQDFATDTGEITLTFKLKRRVIESKYRHLLDAMYAEPATASAGQG